MTRVYSKITIIFAVFLISLLTVSCSNHDLNNKEIKLIGLWNLEVPSQDDKNDYSSYIQLIENRNGIKGLLKVKDSDFISIPMMSHDINHWQLKNDTLIITYTFEGGVISVPGKEDQQYDAFQKKDYLIIKELGEDYFIAESYHPDIPFTSEHMYSRVN